MDKYTQNELILNIRPCLNLGVPGFHVILVQDPCKTPGVSELDYWQDEHPEHTREDWRQEVIDCNTLHGYWTWVVNQQIDDQCNEDMIASET